MRAYVCRRYGGPEVVQLEDVPRPVPKDHEILVRIRATTVTAGDWRTRTLDVPRGLGVLARLAMGITGPRQPILGTELAGVVEEVGGAVTRFQPGDEVFAFPGGKMGCHAEFRTVPEDGPVARRPKSLSWEEAASLPFGGSTALHFLRKAEVRPGERVLVVGASGGVGTALVQLAKHLGVAVTGVTSTANVELVRSLGADRVIDYTCGDFTRGDEAYDVVADTVGQTSFPTCERVLAEEGRFLAIAGGLAELVAAMRGKRADGKRVIAGPAEERPEDVAQLADLATTGALRPVVDRVYAWSEMRAAHAHVETRRKRGSVVVRVSGEG